MLCLASRRKKNSCSDSHVAAAANRDATAAGTHLPLLQLSQLCNSHIHDGLNLQGERGCCEQRSGAIYLCLSPVSVGVCGVLRCCSCCCVRLMHCVVLTNNCTHQDPYNHCCI